MAIAAIAVLNVDDTGAEGECLYASDVHPLSLHTWHQANVVDRRFLSQSIGSLTKTAARRLSFDP